MRQCIGALVRALQVHGTQAMQTPSGTCRVTDDKSVIGSADGVLFYILGQDGSAPPAMRRPAGALWAYSFHESPLHAMVRIKLRRV